MVKNISLFSLFVYKYYWLDFYFLGCAKKLSDSVQLSNVIIDYLGLIFEIKVLGQLHIIYPSVTIMNKVDKLEFFSCVLYHVHIMLI